LLKTFCGIPKQRAQVTYNNYLVFPGGKLKGTLRAREEFRPEKSLGQRRELNTKRKERGHPELEWPLRHHKKK